MHEPSDEAPLDAMGKTPSFAFLLSRLLGNVVGRRRDSRDCPDFERRGADRRSEPRFEIAGAGESISLLFPGEERGQPIRDLSVHGLSFVALPGSRPPEVGAEVDATLLFGPATIPIRLRVTNRRGEISGCRVLSTSRGWLAEIGKILNPRKLGGSLREIDPRFVRQDGDGAQARWFQGEAACDLFTWSLSDGALQRAQLFFMGQVVEWTREHGLRTGAVVEDSERGAIMARSCAFRLDDDRNLETLAFARRLLQAAKVPEEVRARLSGDEPPAN